MQGCFGTVICDGNIRIAVKQKTYNIPESFQARIIQRSITLRIPFVYINSSFFQEYLYNAFLTVTARI